MTEQASIFRVEHFNSAHRLHNDNLSAEENQKLFGKCNNPNYHGHNYKLIVKITGDIDPVTGYVIDTKILSDIIKEEILERFDHRNLNIDTVEFANLNPTTENIAKTIYQIIKSKIESKYTLKITLYETERNYVEFPA